MARTKGSPNKRTFQLIEEFRKLNIDLPERIVELLNSTKDPRNGGLTMRDKLNGYLELLQYVYPKRKAIEFEDTTPDKKNMVFNIRWADEDEPSNSSFKEEDSSTKTNQPI